MSKPKKVYYIEQKGAKLRYGQRGGGLFATMHGLKQRWNILRRAGAETTLWVADVTWREIKPDVEVE